MTPLDSSKTDVNKANLSKLTIDDIWPLRASTRDR